MAEYIYTPAPARLIDFLTKIQSVSTPDKVTQKLLLSLGYKSNNDRYTPGILRALGFTDSSNIPTERWQSYRNKNNAPKVLADSMRELYSSLFALHSDAYRKDDEALNNFFTANSTVGHKAVKFMVATFKALCEIADFTTSQEPVPLDNSNKKGKIFSEESKIQKVTQQLPGNSTGVTLNVNIQITLPETKDNEIYENIFRALKNNIL